jgi:hypothetical protein
MHALIIRALPKNAVVAQSTVGEGENAVTTRIITPPKPGVE